MNRNNKETMLYRAKDSVIGLGKKIAGGAALIGAGISGAMAQSALGTAAAAAVDDVQTDVNGVLIVLVVVVFVLVAWSYLKRAK